MDINDDTLAYIVRETTCLWTRGYITCLMHEAAPARHRKAREIITAAGANNKITAIKDIRAEFQLGLRESKAVVDEFYSSGKIVLPGEDDDPRAVAV